MSGLIFSLGIIVAIAVDFFFLSDDEWPRPRH